MNEENEWDHRISAGVKEGPAHHIRIDGVTAALKKMKRHKAPSSSVASVNLHERTLMFPFLWSQRLIFWSNCFDFLLIL